MRLAFIGTNYELMTVYDRLLVETWLTLEQHLQNLQSVL